MYRHRLMTAVSLKKSNRDSTASWSPLTTAAGARGDDDATSQKSSTSAANDNNEPHETMTDTPSRDYTTIPIQVSTDDTATTDNNDTTAATATATTPTSLSPEPANSDNASSQPDRKNDAKVPNIIRVKSLPFYRGGVRPRHAKIVRFIGRCGFVAKGVVYGIIGVLILTNVSGAWTPNGSQGNESPQVSANCVCVCVCVSMMISWGLLVGCVSFVGRYSCDWSTYSSSHGHWINHLSGLEVRKGMEDHHLISIMT